MLDGYYEKSIFYSSSESRELPMERSASCISFVGWRFSIPSFLRFGISIVFTV